jgi:flavodoxin I
MQPAIPKGFPAPSERFVDGMGLLYDEVKPTGVTLVGTWSKADYTCEASAAEVDGRLVGLALDEDNEPGRTPTRIEAWVQQLQKRLPSTDPEKQDR